LLVNAQHIKAGPGRKTDQKDSEWRKMNKNQANAETGIVGILRLAKGFS
jgi:hypothetical protein